MDTNIIKEFWEDRILRRKFSWAGLDELNKDLAMQFSFRTGTVLSLGCGDESVESHLVEHGRHVVGVDIVKPPAPMTKMAMRFTQDIRTFRMDAKFFTVMMFGVANFFDDDGLREVYRVAHDHTREDGVFIVKHQSAFKDRFEVDTNVDGKRYQATYRSVIEDMQLLEETFGHVECSRAYPNRQRQHDNSDFYLYKAWKLA